jgi:hypothetical protein
MVAVAAAIAQVLLAAAAVAAARTLSTVPLMLSCSPLAVPQATLAARSPSISSEALRLVEDRSL